MPEFRSSAYSNYSHATIEQPVNIQRVKDKLIYDIIRQTNDDANPAFDPLRLQFFSLSKLILQYQKTKNEKNYRITEIIQKSDTNRKESLTEKNRLYNTEYNSLTIQNMKKVRQSLNKSLDSRMNLNDVQAQTFVQLIEQLKSSELSISEEAKSFMGYCRGILITGKRITAENISQIKKQIGLNNKEDPIITLVSSRLMNPHKPTQKF